MPKGEWTSVALSSGGNPVSADGMFATPDDTATVIKGIERSATSVDRFVQDIVIVFTV
jgi:hypothetical protein